MANEQQQDFLQAALPQPKPSVVTEEQWAAFGVQFDDAKRAAILDEVRAQTDGVVHMALHGDGLRKIKTKNGVDIFQGAVEGSAINLVRGVTRCHGHVRDAALIGRHVRDTPSMRADFAALDPMNEDSIVVADLTPEVASDALEQELGLVAWGTFAVPGPPWSRDFVWGQLYTYRPEEDRFIITAGCVADDAGVPDMQGSHRRVRGSILQTGYCFSQVGDNEIEIAYVVQVDPRGMLPTWVVNLVAADQAENAGRMRDRLSRFITCNALFDAREGALAAARTHDVVIKPRTHLDVPITAAAADATLEFAIHTPDGTLGVAISGVDNEWQEWARHETGDAPLAGSIAVPAGATVTFKLDNGFSWRSSKNVFLRMAWSS